MLRSSLSNLPFCLALTLSLAFSVCAASHRCDAQELQSVLDHPITVTSSTQQLTAPQVNPPADAATDVPSDVPTDAPTHQSIDAGDDIDALITGIVLKNIPHQFSEDKDWGGQEKRWDGVDFRREGLQIRTHRKTKMVNHGTWRKYDVSLLNPDEQFAISIKNMREAEDGKMAFDVHVSANLKIDGRQARWAKGIQLFNVSIDGKTRVNVMATIELRTLMNVTKFPPELVFRPEATAAEISLEDFRIDRVSKVGGEVTQQITRVARQAIEDRIEKEEAKAVKKLNAEFEKNADKLKLSLAEAMSSKWSAVAQKFMSADAKAALDN